QLGEILDQAGALLLDHGGLRPVVEARHPGLVAPQQMTERAMDRGPESAARLLPLGVGKAASGGMEAPVHLGIVGRHGAHERRLHAALMKVRPGHDGHTPMLSISRVLPMRAATSRRIGPSLAEATAASVSACRASR